MTQHPWMPSRGIKLVTCPKPRLETSLLWLAVRSSAKVVMSAFKPKSVCVFVAIELYGEPDRSIEVTS
jgi:hypothetical protein